MQLVLVAVLVFHLLGALARRRQPDIDINRVKPLTNDVYPSYPVTKQGRNSVGYQYKKSNDYDYYSSILSKWGKTVPSLHDASTNSIPKTIEMHQPREDPRLFYLSKSYLEESHRKNINREVSEIYPGREVIRANEFDRRSLPIVSMDRYMNRINSGNHYLCVRCPHDRTLTAKPGSDRVMLQSPSLNTCSGLTSPRGVRFSTVYGPQNGSLLEKGSHMIIGRISYKSKILKMCKMQVHVTLHGCPVPSYLTSRCDDKGKLCNFTCRNTSLEMYGRTALSCEDHDNMDSTGWTGKLPVCRARSWCVPPSPPNHGHLSCKGITKGDAGLSEGSTCRVRCARGWYWSPRAATVCRAGAWTYNLTCTPKKIVTLKSFYL